ncbi:related to gamma-tubulin complex component 5 [Ustilago sp. UG-2017b]|nr:related to gamma-tubulin complex component 5 [Ustilago sp. UG-2017b]
MSSVADPFNGGGLADRAAKATTQRIASRSKTNKRIDQERILDRLVSVFLQDTEPSSSSRAAQKAKAIQVVERDTWSPADVDEIAAAVQGLSLKHSIHLDHELSIALRRCYSELLTSCERSVRITDQARDAYKRRGLDARNVPDPSIRPDNVSDAAQLLLQLSKPADVTARTAANLILNATQANRVQYLTPEQRKQAEKREWLGILVDEPLEGVAWVEGGGEEDGSELSDWSLDSDDAHRKQIEEGYDSDKEVRKRRNRLTAVSASIQPTVSASADFEGRETWTKQRQSRSQGLSDAVDQSVRSAAGLTEADAVRESHAALMGGFSVLFERDRAGKVTLADLAFEGQRRALAGLFEQLQGVATLASTFASIRTFVNATIAQSIQAVDAVTRTPAVEAFAEQLQILLERLSLQLSELDADIAVASMPGFRAVIRTDRYVTLTQLLQFVQREAASVLLLAQLLRAMGFIPSTGDGDDASVVSRASSDRALIDGLQALLGFVHQQDQVAHSEVILADLSTCLLAACRPAWRSVCQLIRRGLSFAITRDHDPIFDDRLVQHLVRHDTSLPTSDPTFWTHGYVPRGVEGDVGDELGADMGYNPPVFLQSIIGDVLTTAKGVGLLRSLGVDALGVVQPNADLDEILGLHDKTSSIAHDDDHEDRASSEAESHAPLEEQQAPMTSLEAQNKLRQLLFKNKAGYTEGQQHLGKQQAPEVLPQTPLSQPDAELLWGMAPSPQARRTPHHLLEPLLGRSLQEHLAPISAIVRKRLTEVLSSSASEGGYALQSHLRACHGLFFMQRGAEMTSWTVSLFLDLGQRHGTFRALQQHRLNSIFSDALEAYQQGTMDQAWIDANLVRLSTGDDELESMAAIRQRTRLRRLADIRVHYELPWPLTFVFPPRCMRFYQSAFTTLLQARYAQWKLASTLKRAKPETMHMRKFWALRRQAQWLVRTLMEFVQRDVLLDGSEQLCVGLEGRVSLDGAIKVHTEALDRMEMLCFHRVEQARVKGLMSLAWRLGVEVANNYEQYIGASSREEDRQARRKRRERRKKRRDKAKRDGAPLGIIAEEDEEEDEEDEEEDADDAAEMDEDDSAGMGDYDAIARSAAVDIDGRTSDIYDSTSVDASMSADMSASWMEPETHKRERFRIECERQRKALHRLVEELKISIDGQIGRVAAKAAMRAQDATQADRALQEHDQTREKWQALLYALAWSDLTY